MLVAKLSIVGIFFILMGMTTLIHPTIINKLFEIDGKSGSFNNEVRSVYGGFGIFFGILTLSLIFTFEIYRDGVILAQATALFGMASGRIYSFIFEKTNKFPIIFLIVEIFLGFLLLSILA